MQIIVNEGTTSYLDVVFRDRYGQICTPTSITWAVRDAETGEVLQPDTPVEPASQITLVLHPGLVTILNPANKVETRKVTVKATYGENDGCNAEHDVIVRNLIGV